jgi:alkanesulfonate monooxygenase SsuD/methylene tetrahydromethanopterin reductase-like flavin-dependent oxidoreductase (luciferase family)
MLKLTGQYADMFFVPPWVQGKVQDLISEVESAAEEAGRVGPALMLGTMDAKAYSLKEYAAGIEDAAELGARYYAVAFPRDDPTAMSRFSEEVMPSYC